jgi:hypothetical protein
MDLLHEFDLSTLQRSHLPVGSLRWKTIGDEGARDLGAALLVNTTLMKLE